jgi:hypothetical protein
VNKGQNMSALKKKPRVIIPAPAERGEALVADIADLALHERIDALRPLVAALQPLLDRTLDELADHLRPKGELKPDAHGELTIVGSIVAGSVRHAMDEVGGRDLLNVFLTATKN